MEFESQAIEFIKRCCEKAGYNQSRLARELGLHSSHMSRLFAGEAPLTVDLAQRILSLFGLGLSSLDNLTEAPKLVKPAISDELREAVLEVARSAAKEAVNLGIPQDILESLSHAGPAEFDSIRAIILGAHNHSEKKSPRRKKEAG